jgi:3-oxoacyl-[acyl-carrier protein] reductase
MALHYSRSIKDAETLRDSLQALHPSLELSLHQADLTLLDDCQKLVREVSDVHGHVDILVSNAGGARRVTNILYTHMPVRFFLIDIREVTLEDFENTINLNLRVAFLLVKNLVEPMQQQRWGRIIFVSSIAAYGGGINGPHYAASKGGLTGLMRNLSTHLAQYNISVLPPHAVLTVGERCCTCDD